MVRHTLRAGAAALLAAILTITSSAAQSAPNAAGVVYRLGPDVALVRGCFPPCLCPIISRGQVRGTFVLRPMQSASNVHNYHMDDVNWLARVNDTDWRITGSGILRRLGGPVPAAQRLELDLRINDEPVAHFDSGWQPPTVDFPRVGLPININGGVCYDTQINLNAAPVPGNQLRRYRVRQDTTLQQGCFPPCLCPIELLGPLVGTFTLVPVPIPGESGPIHEYAVVHARMAAQNDPAGGPRFRGLGFHDRNASRAQGGPNPDQRMFLDLRSTPGVAPEHFDSRVVATTASWPAIDITLTVNDFVCYDRVIHLIAQPVNGTP